MILDALEAHPSGLTFSQLYAMGICGKQALDKYLEQLGSTELVLHERKGMPYRLNPWLNEVKLPRVQGVAPQIVNRGDLITHVNLEFERAYYQYVRLLQMIVKQRSDKQANDFFEFYFTKQIQRQLDSLARFVWRKRDRIKIGDEPYFAEYAVTVFRPISFLSPKRAERVLRVMQEETLADIREHAREFQDKTVDEAAAQIRKLMETEQ